ncbi:hypothetical protein HPB51_019983 [Rhipicephalus microplus]|uniref:KIND domain-containing protein n=1 Tax=Rhipicephalus microplus TaxID=6941 RepID=A0A9J6DBL6_RHIMP|nr:hypothetical protein HPB51_019983 [Rhipicephalus microplus]
MFMKRQVVYCDRRILMIRMGRTALPVAFLQSVALTTGAAGHGFLEAKCAIVCPLPEKDALVCSLGLVLFHALEYGLRPDEEHVLSRPFEMLLDRMTSADPEANSEAELSSDDESGEEDCHDEGIEKDSGEDDPGGGDGGDGPGKTPHRAGLTLAKVLEMCASHLQNPAQADLHYKAVCRALVAEAVELSTFLQKISSGTKEFIKCHRSDPDTSDLDGLQFQDWAMLWMQVIRELRQGVKLKKVDIETHLHPVEFELTPYEMLLDDIRSQRYKLNKVMASRRKLKPAPRRETSVHDRLMADIRQPQRLRPVRKRGSAGTSGVSCNGREHIASYKPPELVSTAGMGRFGGFWKYCRSVSRAGYRRIPVLTVWPIFQRWSDQRPLAQWRNFVPPWPRGLFQARASSPAVRAWWRPGSEAETSLDPDRGPNAGACGGISDVVDGPPSSPPPLAPQREQLKRGAAVVRRTGKRPVHPWSVEDDTSVLSLDMKELGAESDEDVGLGLDLDDEEEFLKCIEDDCAAAFENKESDKEMPWDILNRKRCGSVNAGCLVKRLCLRRRRIVIGPSVSFPADGLYRSPAVVV